MRIVIFLSSISLIILIATFFYSIVFGIPIHDIDMLMLKRAYSRVEHPTASAILADAVYLGGPHTHGSWRCSYVVGEVRSAPLSKQELREAYRDKTLKTALTRLTPLKVLFFDEQWPNELPWFRWESDFSSFENISDTPYLVYGAQTDIPFFGDMRCDN